MQRLADPSPADPESVKLNDLVDLSGGTWGTGGNTYCTKNFRYQRSFADTNGHLLFVFRCTPKADCSGCQSDWDYRLQATLDGSTRDCDYKTDMGKKVCTSTFQSQGYTPVDW